MFPIQYGDDSGGGIHACNLPHCKLDDSFDAIWDMPEVEVLSNGANFLNLQVWHMVYFKGSHPCGRIMFPGDRRLLCELSCKSKKSSW